MGKAKIVIPGRFPGFNDIIRIARANKFKSADQKKMYTELVGWYAKKGKVPRFERVDITCTWYEPNMQRNKDNIAAGLKYILDGLVEAGVLKNDGWKQIGNITHRYEVDAKNPRVEVELIGGREDA
jgi:Holliday junction resolvase RusA-like endonuclease